MFITYYWFPGFISPGFTTTGVGTLGLTALGGSTDTVDTALDRTLAYAAAKSDLGIDPVETTQPELTQGGGHQNINMKVKFEQEALEFPLMFNIKSISTFELKSIHMLRKNSPVVTVQCGGTLKTTAISFSGGSDSSWEDLDWDIVLTSAKTNFSGMLTTQSKLNSCLLAFIEKYYSEILLLHYY